jgi:signal transduction histidine kinase
LILLKATQAQLIQSEKMASLGELTAGIAHEIQNPLNFVNNFSELNKELVAEAVEELEQGDIEETKVILKDIGDNSGKINHHGKRADAIVKGMLAHSRAGKGENALTDLNVLTEEYLKLSYHGMLAKDKSFKVGFKTEFDAKVPKMDVIPQDIGRVVLNLINNAFQEVYAKEVAKERSDYKPLVSVNTKKTESGIEISVSDNGNGIPKQLRDKIFQPFFTTKPTGQGTGLGLSLSYDIVKAHGGELEVESKENEGSKFIIKLPIV